MYILKLVFCVATLLGSGGCPVALEGDVHGSGAGLLGPDGRLVLQGCASGVEGVLEVIVQQTAEGRHVDVGEAGETAWEVGRVVVRAEKTTKLGVEDVFGP